jgi:hypothetical protein
MQDPIRIADSAARTDFLCTEFLDKVVIDAGFVILANLRPGVVHKEFVAAKRDKFLTQRDTDVA